VRPSTLPRLLLETSEAIAYVNDESRAPDVEQLLEWAEAGRIELAMARAGWAEIRDRPGDERKRRGERLRRGVRYVGNVAKLDSAILDVDVLGGDETQRVDADSPQSMSPSDRERLLVHQVGGYDYLVTSDHRFTQHQTRTRISERLGLEIGDATQAVAFLRRLWANPDLEGP
jgi:hypothetical protein